MAECIQVVNRKAEEIKDRTPRLSHADEEIKAGNFVCTTISRQVGLVQLLFIVFNMCGIKPLPVCAYAYFIADV